MADAAYYSMETGPKTKRERYEQLRAAAKSMAHTINACCPHGPDKSDAIRKLRECLMTANAAVALESTTMASGVSGTFGPGIGKSPVELANDPDYMNKVRR